MQTLSLSLTHTLLETQGSMKAAATLNSWALVSLGRLLGRSHSSAETRRQSSCFSSAKRRRDYIPGTGSTAPRPGGKRERDEGGRVVGGQAGALEWREIQIDRSKNGGRPTYTELAGSLGCPRSPSAPSCDLLAGKRKISFLFLECFAIWETFLYPFFASYDKTLIWGCEHSWGQRLSDA